MVRHLTAKRAKHYFEESEEICPVCHSEDIQGNDVNFESGSIWQNMECNLCGFKWYDIYHLVGIGEISMDAKCQTEFFKEGTDG